MGREQLLNSCLEVFSQFENPNASDPDEHSFVSFLSWFMESTTEFLENILKESEAKIEDQSASDVFYTLLETFIILSFGMGVALGSVGTFKDPDVRKHIEEIRDAIEQNRLLEHLGAIKNSTATA